MRFAPNCLAWLVWYLLDLKYMRKGRTVNVSLYNALFLDSKLLEINLIKFKELLEKAWKK